MTMITNIPHSTVVVPIGRKFAAYLGNCINNWLAAWIAHQGRQATRKTLLSFSDRQLKDIGIGRSQIDSVLNHPTSRD